MADGVSIDPGTTTEIATDDCGASGHTQIVKLAVSANGDATPITADSGGLLVNLGSNNDVVVSDGGNVISVDDAAGSLTVDNAALSVTGGGVESSALRVTLASDSTGVLSVDDNGSSLTVDGSVSIGSALPAGTNAIGKLAANSGVDIGDVDVTSVTPGTGASNLGKAEDAAHSTGDVGVMALAVRDSTGSTTFAGADGDYSPLACTATGSLWTVNPSIWVEDSQHSSGDQGTMVLAVRNDGGSALAGTDGDYIPLSTDSNGALRVTGGGGGTEYTEGDTDASITGSAILWEDASDTLRAVSASKPLPVGDGGGALTVDNAGTFAVQVDGSALTALQLIDDPVATTGSAIPSKGMAISGTDGTNARVLKTDTSGELQVDVLTMPTVTVNSHAVTNAGTFAVQVDGSALTALQLIDDPVFADDAAFTPGTSKVMVAGFEADEASTDSVDEGDAGAARMTLDRKQIVTHQPHSAGGLSIFRSLDLDESEEDVKTSPGCVYGMWVTNTATSTRFVKFYNATAANVTVGSTTPVITIGIPGNSSDDVSGNFGPGGTGIMFDTAISVAATTGVADNDTGAPSANDVIVNVFYK